MADATVLLVDDEPALVRAVTAGLEARGYRVRSSLTGRAAIAAAASAEPDVTLLDLGLPDLDGVTVCRELRRHVGSPIIVLSADGAVDRKVAAFEEGADDYVTKPFSMPELLARIAVAVRHRRALAAIVDAPVVEVGPLAIDVAGHQARLGDRQLELTRKELALLTVLARHAGTLLTHAALLEQVWGPRQGMDTLRTHVTQLRRKLGAGGDDRVQIVTEPGIGYRLVGPDDVR
jgi:two-component system KDP operon response regulator KdpE